MIYQEGYVYHIKDEYFEKVHDSSLMQNKENGTYRPTFYCLRDTKNLPAVDGPIKYPFRICFQSGSTIWIIYIPAITTPYL